MDLKQSLTVCMHLGANGTKGTAGPGTKIFKKINGLPIHLKMKKIIQFLTFYTLAWSAYAADAPNTKEINLESSKSCALRKAEQVILEKYSTYDKKNRKPVIVDDGENWKFYYELPPLILASSPVVIIDKKTCEVVKSYLTQ